jgi:glycosyltransferase involved in cell wall biosynthesis
VFVGGTTWFPNKDGLDFFRTDILPHLRAGEPAVEVSWVGRCSEEEKRTVWEQDQIEMTGYVPDIRPWVHAAACFIVPLRVGGGTRLKVLDAWAMGKAVVSTSVGCEGLLATDGHNILIRDDPAEFASAVQAVLRDSELRHRLGREARRTVEQHYGWESIGLKLANEYLDILAGHDAMDDRQQPATLA